MKKQLQYWAVLSASVFLAMCTPLTSFAGGGWSQQDDRWIYTEENGERASNKWIKNEEESYWIDEYGFMASDGLRRVQEDYYYFREDGTMVRGEWLAIPNPSAGNEGEPEQYWYYFQENGKACRRPDVGTASLKTKTIDGKKYAFDAYGRMLYGWVFEGERQTGEDAWQYSNYYFGEENDGVMHEGWLLMTITDVDAYESQPGSRYWDEDQDRWFYFEDGKKVSGKQDKCKIKVINGNKYGFDEFGRMISTWYAEEITLATSRSEAGEGNPYQGNEDYSRGFMYFGTPESGARYTKGWFRACPSEYLMKSKYDEESTYMYYADGDGHIVANEIRTIDGERYGFDNAGRAFSGMVCLKMDSETTPSQINYSFYSDATVTSGRAPFASKEEFDDLVETYAEDFQSGLMRFYCFGGANGAMLTGKQNLQLGKSGQRYEFMFETKGNRRGSGVYGEKNGKLYKAGMLVTPKDDGKFAIYKQHYETLPEDATTDEKKEFNKRDIDKDGKIEGVLEEIPTEQFLSEVCNSGIEDEDGEVVWNVRYDPEGVRYYLIDENGFIARNRVTSEDDYGYSFKVKNRKIVTVTRVPEGE